MGAGARYRQCPPRGSAEPLDGGGLGAGRLRGEGAAPRCAGIQGLASPPLPLGTLPPRRKKGKPVPQLSPLAAAGRPRLSPGPHRCCRRLGFGPHRCRVAVEGRDGRHAQRPRWAGARGTSGPLSARLSPSAAVVFRSLCPGSPQRPAPSLPVRSVGDSPLPPGVWTRELQSRGFCLRRRLRGLTAGEPASRRRPEAPPTPVLPPSLSGAPASSSSYPLAAARGLPLPPR